MTDYSKMTDREIDALMAEFMGWRRVEHAWQLEHGCYSIQKLSGVVAVQKGDAIRDWLPTEDANAAREVIRRVEELGLVGPFVAALDKLITGQEPETVVSVVLNHRFEVGSMILTPTELFKFLNATPKQYCIAALTAKGEGK